MINIEFLVWSLPQSQHKSSTLWGWPSTCIWELCFVTEKNLAKVVAASESLNQVDQAPAQQWQSLTGTLQAQVTRQIGDSQHFSHQIHVTVAGVVNSPKPDVGPRGVASPHQLLRYEGCQTIPLSLRHLPCPNRDQVIVCICHSSCYFTPCQVSPPRHS